MIYRSISAIFIVIASLIICTGWRFSAGRVRPIVEHGVQGTLLTGGVRATHERFVFCSPALFVATKGRRAFFNDSLFGWTDIYSVTAQKGVLFKQGAKALQLMDGVLIVEEYGLRLFFTSATFFERHIVFTHGSYQARSSDGTFKHATLFMRPAGVLLEVEGRVVPNIAEIKRYLVLKRALRKLIGRDNDKTRGL